MLCQNGFSHSTFNEPKHFLTAPRNLSFAQFVLRTVLIRRNSIIGQSSVQGVSKVEPKIRITVVPGSNEDQWYHPYARTCILIPSEESPIGTTFRPLSVSASITPNDIIQGELGLPLQTSKQVPIIYHSFPRPRGKTKKCTLITSYCLICPALPDYPAQRAKFQPAPLRDEKKRRRMVLYILLSHSQLVGRRLLADIPINNQRIIEDTALVLVKTEKLKFDRAGHYPFYRVPLYTEPVRDARRFDEIVRGRIQEINKSQKTQLFPTKSQLLATLLYTDEDVELAQYIRLNYASIDKMSGPDCSIFILERPPKISLAETIGYWKERLPYEAYALFAGKGQTRTKPYDKTSAYDIARQLGVFPDQLPCIVFFEQIRDEDKVVIPIQGNLSEFFRTLFGSIQKGPSANRRSLLEAIRARVMSLGTKTTSNKDRISYHFEGKTVFINRPAGRVELRGFQNNSMGSSNAADKGGTRQ
jgi:hypothetical protein